MQPMLTGHGSWNDDGYFGNLSFEGTVGSRQTVDMNGATSLTIGDPTGFHGLVDIEQGWVGGYETNILLAGIHGDSFTYRHDMLTISSAGKVVDRLRIADPNGAFSVSDTTAGTSINPVIPPSAQQYAGAILHIS